MWASDILPQSSTLPYIDQLQPLIANNEPQVFHDIARFCVSGGYQGFVLYTPIKIDVYNINHANAELVLNCIFSSQVNADLSSELSLFLSSLPNKAQYLLVCLDVLHKTPPSLLADVMSNLSALTTLDCLVSISLASLLHGNSICLPIATWHYIFNLYGFDVLASSDIFLERMVGFDIDANPEPILISLRKNYEITPSQSPRIMLDKILDLEYINEKRALSPSFQGVSFGFNIIHDSDFYNIQPILDVIDKDKTVFFLRRGMLRQDFIFFLQQFCELRRLKLIQFEKIQEIVWAELSIDVLVSAGESSIARSHLLASQLVEAAKIHDVRTIHLQHGIFTGTFEDRQVSFSSEIILAFGKQFRSYLNQPFMVANQLTTVGDANDKKWLYSGSGKYFDMEVKPNDSILKYRLGIDRAFYKKIIFVGISFHCVSIRLPRNVLIEKLNQLVTANPQFFFIFKAHPALRYKDYSDLCQSNSLVVDDLYLQQIGLSTNRLLVDVDLVLTTFSSLILDATVASKPCIQYSTNSNYKYMHCKPVPIDLLHPIINQESHSSVDRSEFLEFYNEPGNMGFYQVLREAIDMPHSITKSFRLYSIIRQLE